MGANCSYKGSTSRFFRENYVIDGMDENHAEWKILNMDLEQDPEKFEFEPL